jgi:uncharacterized protein YjbI with pentapeptide repeats
MRKDEYRKILDQGVETWNQWRSENADIRPSLTGMNLERVKLRGANFFGVNLGGARLSGADLSRANLCGSNLNKAMLNGAMLRFADLSHSNLRGANLSGSKLREAFLNGALLNGAQLDTANLRGARLAGATLRDALLAGADLRRSDLSGVDFHGAHLVGANFEEAGISGAVFSDVDLREVKGLEAVNHLGPSEISVSTLYRSEGKIPEAFLRGCGVPESFIIQIPALVAAMQPIQFYSCFISYSGKDDDFARRLHSQMREAELRVWFAPEDMKSGDKIYDQIDRAIQVHDRLLLVLSEDSLQSKWVELEIRRARRVELKENRRKLFPIRLTSYEALLEWVCVDSTTGEDLAEEVRSYFIPDFSNWKEHDAFEESFARLYADLKASAV